MTQRSDSGLRAGGPYFDDLEVGLVVDWAPAVTLTDGQAAAHQAIVGDRLAIALDTELGEAVTRTAGTLAHPALVWDIVIGQSTLLTQRVKANLFYRGLAFHRTPVIGDTLSTTAEVVGLRENSQRPGRQPTGMAAIRIRTVDQLERPVLDFTRCAMLPLSGPDAVCGVADDLDQLVSDVDPMTAAAELVSGWNFGIVGGRASKRFAMPEPGVTLPESPGDVVSSAPELARLTLNVAAVHHDATVSESRLVYGGHTIGIAAAQAARQLPRLLTIASWYSCDHTGPVREDDTLFSTTTIERIERLPSGGALACLRTLVRSVSTDGSGANVLNWRYVGVIA